ncbi:MAG: hypothetical protein KAX40_00520 [Herpetosiphon sp.]|nr:hypothetical protein [Herpetosiphon sp.]
MINWWMTLLGIVIITLIWLVLAKLGFVRWWKRRRAVVQLLLMVVIPALLIALTVGLSLLLAINITDLAGLLFGVGLAMMGFLLATSYLIDQIRLAFSDSDGDESAK